MKAAPLLIAWHDDNAPIYSAHFEPHGKGRLATAGKYVLCVMFLFLFYVIPIVPRTNNLAELCCYVCMYLFEPATDSIRILVITMLEYAESFFSFSPYRSPSLSLTLYLMGPPGIRTDILATRSGESRTPAKNEKWSILVPS